MAFFELAENLARKFRMWGARKINLAGDRDIEWSWVAAHVPQGPGRALDFGCGGGALGLLAVQKGFEVTAVDLEEIRWFYWHPKLKFLREDIFSVKRFGADCFDLVINCSAVEHVGLAGRYGDG
ncbi:MAG TPA: methyltransferase domain-containing protein [Candidatus Omnitrophota bacterium]|nr:methyltransferase domain-containing protein [Candidatus Omnitrophota bacterium]